MPALLRLLLPMLLGYGSQLGIGKGLGLLGRSTAAPKVLSGLAKKLTGPGLLPGAVAFGSVIPGFVAGEALLGSPEDASSNASQFQQLVNQMGAPRPVTDNQRGLMELLQAEQARGTLNPLLEQLGVGPGVV